MLRDNELLDLEDNMISLMPANVERRSLTRRDILRLSAWSAAGLSLPSLAEAANGATTTHRPTAKNCIYIFLCGGPSQLDMWDPKPNAPKQIRGPFSPIHTNVAGIHIGDLLPSVSRHADKFSLIRSMSIGTSSHETGIFRTLLASKVGTAKNRSFPAEPSDHPAIGAILHKLLGPTGNMPPWAVIPRHFMTGDHFYKGQAAGFLGPAFAPFSLATEKKDSLGRTEFPIKNAQLYGKEMNPERFAGRRSLLGELQSLNAGPGAETKVVRSLQRQYDSAYRMLTSKKFKQAFDVTRERQTDRERYGMNEYGQSFLLARRLVERDVRMVNLFWTFYGKDGCQFNLWDNHGAEGKVCGGPRTGLAMIKHDYCCPSFDRAFSALLEDLTNRGMLEETMIVVVGEFGRTPKINKWSGRDHWGSCYSAVLAGGGIQGGRIHGASDNHAAYVKDAPVSPYDLHATILHGFGFGPETAVPDQTGRPVRITDGQPLQGLF